MLPTLSSPSDAIEAVSTLLYHVGASFESIYGASIGATDVSVTPALMRHLGYDKGINYVKRDYFTAEDWNILLESNEEDTVTYLETVSLESGKDYVVRLLNDTQTVGEFSGIAVEGTSGITDTAADMPQILITSGYFLSCAISFFPARSCYRSAGNGGCGERDATKGG